MSLNQLSHSQRAQLLRDQRRMRKLALQIPNEAALESMLRQVESPLVRRQVYIAISRFLRFKPSTKMVVRYTMDTTPRRLGWRLKWLRVKIALLQRWGRFKRLIRRKRT